MKKTNISATITGVQFQTGPGKTIFRPVFSGPVLSGKTNIQALGLIVSGMLKIKGISQADLSSAAGLSKKQINLFLNGKLNGLTTDFIDRLCIALDENLYFDLYKLNEKTKGGAV